MIYLYLKTHNVTGLKYLGKTKQNPFKYEGSGVLWSEHLKKYSNDVTTVVLKECNTNEEIRYWGIYYSELWDVVNSKDFANMKRECGDNWDDQPIPDQIKKKISKSLLGRKHDPKTKEKISQSLLVKNSSRDKHHNKDRKQSVDERNMRKTLNSGSGNPMFGKQHSEEAREKMAMAKRNKKQAIVTCPYCAKIGGITGMKQFHFDKCKMKQPQ